MERQAEREITAAKAIIRGHLVVTAPVLFGIFVTIVASIVAHVLIESVPAVIATSVIGLSSSMLYGAQAHVKWRIWAFNRVRNVHELRDLAILKGMLRKRKSLLGAFEISSLEQRQILLELDRRFEENVTFGDDKTVERCTTLRRRKIKNLLSLLASTALLMLGIVILAVVPSVKSALILGVLLIFSGIIGVFTGWRKWRVRDVPLVLSDDGVESMCIGFVPWGDIRDEAVENHGHSGGRDVVLTFRYGGAKLCTIHLADYIVKEERLLYLLRLYRGRHSKRQERSR